VRVYAATKNVGKLRELKAIFATFGWEVVAFEGYEEPLEGETSYEENAALKARALAEQLQRAGVADAAVVGDDSGLEVAALGGRPGVLSARYGPADATWSERRRALVEELAQTHATDRCARFVCAMHLVSPDGAEVAARGKVDGQIAESERGESGFSYDAIFLYPPLAKTFAELTEEQKNTISHRAAAATELTALLTTRRPRTSL
jgi:non-canonical purine NTP pyrophosphatase (RdgB/HAM1 family)